jgi:hypothetical protein
MAYYRIDQKTILADLNRIADGKTPKLPASIVAHYAAEELEGRTDQPVKPVLPAGNPRGIVLLGRRDASVAKRP